MEKKIEQLKEWYNLQILKLGQFLIKTALQASPSILIVLQVSIAMTIYDNRRKDGRLNIFNCGDVATKVVDTMFLEKVL